MQAGYLQAKFSEALDWEQYLSTAPQRAAPWRRIYDQVSLDDDQRRLVEGFTRTVNILAISGIWCGDCAQQGPLIQRIADGNDRIQLRWIDRDEHRDLSEQFPINAGQRVPIAIFMAEDFEPVSVFGDRTLMRYRALAAKQLGGACPLPGAAVPQDELRATLQDWLDEVERVHLLLRLSGRLRQRHGD